MAYTNIVFVLFWKKQQQFYLCTNIFISLAKDQNRILNKLCRNKGKLRAKLFYSTIYIEIHKITTATKKTLRKRYKKRKKCMQKKKRRELVTIKYLFYGKMFVFQIQKTFKDPNKHNDCVAYTEHTANLFGF